MRVLIEPSRAEGTVTAPPSKSIAHRALIAAALADGTSTIRPISRSEDMLATMDVLSAFGARFCWEGDTVTVSKMPLPPRTEKTLFCRESGSTLRFLLPLGLISGETSRFTGAPRLMQRPLSVYDSLCRERGIRFERDGDFVTVKGRLTAGEYRVPGDVSSQFITGLLFALSLVDGESCITVEKSIKSASYLDLTLDAMAAFGQRVRREGNRFYLSGPSSFSARNFTVEADESNAAFLEGFNLLGGKVTILGLRENSLQGDRVWRDIFSLMKKERATVSLADCPDLAPVIMALAPFYHGVILTDTARLKIKESDRGAAMARELAKCGVSLTVEDDRIEVPACRPSRPTQPIESHRDHRIVMAMSLVLSQTGGTIEGAEAVAKSYPDFFEVIKSLGIEVKKDETES